MDNVFKKFDKDIRSVKDAAFGRYLRSEVLDADTAAMLDELVQATDVYVFSGVIRDYFVHREARHRDLDLVLKKEIPWHGLYRKYRNRISVNINSYGGFKIQSGTLHVDIWTMKRTWGLVKKGIRLTPQNLIRTAFFNFSSIAYSIRSERFYIHKGFVEFMNRREIGIQYRENPNAPLCILNSMHYRDRLEMPLSAELKRWIVAHYSIFDDYKTPQLSHWGVVKYSEQDIWQFVSECGL